jgi:hypothetical protein
MRVVRATALVGAVGLWANCVGAGSQPLPVGSASALDAGLVAPLGAPAIDADASGRAVNSAGQAYPTDDIGGRPRKGSQAGQRFPDLTFEGLLSVATAVTPAIVSMADYYDPDGLRYDLLHVMAIFLWCPHCSNETTAVAKLAAWQSSHRVATLQIAMQGYGSASPTWAEVQKWAGDHNVGFPVVVDGQGAQLGAYFPVRSVPVNIVVNPRTMEVLAVDIGEQGDIQAYEQGFLNSL